MAQIMDLRVDLRESIQDGANVALGGSSLAAAA